MSFDHPQTGPTFADFARDADLDFTRPFGPARNRVVLVVDPDEAAGERTASILRQAGYSAAVERSPRAAARHMSRLGAPALLLLEELPQVNGIDFLARIRASSRFGATPVVLYAARADAPTLLAVVRKVLGEQPAPPR